MTLERSRPLRAWGRHAHRLGLGALVLTVHAVVLILFMRWTPSLATDRPAPHGGVYVQLTGLSIPAAVQVSTSTSPTTQRRARRTAHVRSAPLATSRTEPPAVASATRSAPVDEPQAVVDPDDLPSPALDDPRKDAPAAAFAGAPIATAPQAPALAVLPHELALECPQRAAPPYPAQAWRNAEEGGVTLRVELAEDGRVADVRVHRSSGHAALDEAAVLAVRQWRCDPPRQGDRSVRAVAMQTIRFALAAR